MVLAYVNKGLSDWRQVLGEHKWSEAFRPGTVPPSDAHRVSRVFYSKYSTHREAEKAGWKVKYITNEFVTEKVYDICAKPYPPTSWCPTPELDRTNDSWVRALPADLFPDAPQPAPKPVGKSRSAPVTNSSSSLCSVVSGL